MHSGAWRVDSPVWLRVACLSTEEPAGRKMKVLFAFGLVQQEAAECQAVESATAARPCAERAEMNNSEFPRACSALHRLLSSLLSGTSDSPSRCQLSGTSRQRRSQVTQMYWRSFAAGQF